MLGNWSLGDYWKKEAIEYSFEFLTKVLKIPKERLAVSVFKGDENASKDNESAKIWESLGISKERIVFLGKKDNWWGPAGKTGPCGPDTEMFYWKDNSKKAPKKFDPNNENWVEIWNDVLMQYTKDGKGNYNEAKQKNVDTGMGVERTVTILNGLEDDYLSDTFKPIINEIEKISKKKYKGNEKRMRIIADHIKASIFIIGDGIQPSNTEQGYVLRKLIRRLVRYGRGLEIKNFTKQVANPVFKIYDDYLELKKNKKRIIDELEKEESNFLEILEKGGGIFQNITKGKKQLSGKDVFLLYQSHGFPLEITQERAKEKRMEVDIRGFEKELKKHQELSRTERKGKFIAGLADSSEQTTKYHTLTHVLHKVLKIVLGNEVQQMGSNITQERIRFDFSFSRKLTEKEVKKIEHLVNKQVKRNLPVTCEEMPYTKAVKAGALSYFKERYPEIVKVYTVGDFSKEICTGPHVENTSEIKEKFKIVKESSSSAGVRRIRAVLE